MNEINSDTATPGAETAEGAPSLKVVSAPRRVTRRRKGKARKPKTRSATTSSSEGSQARAKPNRQLPTDRIAVRKQLDLLRAYAIASEQNGGGPVTYREVAAIVKMHPVTPALATSFFIDVGLLGKAGQQGFLPSPEVVAYNHAFQWNPDTATQKLAPLLLRTWFARHLVTALNFSGSLTLDTAISKLAEQANASPDYRSQLVMLIDLLDAVGVLARDGNQIRKGNMIGAVAGEVEPTSAPTAPPAPPADSDRLPTRGKLLDGLWELLPPADAWQEAELEDWLGMLTLALRVRYHLPERSKPGRLEGS